MHKAHDDHPDHPGEHWHGLVSRGDALEDPFAKKPTSHVEALGLKPAAIHLKPWAHHRVKSKRWLQDLLTTTSRPTNHEARAAASLLEDAQIHPGSFYH